MTDDELIDRGFAALADPVRRAVVARLSRGPATVGEIAEPFDISLQAVSRHLRVLEEAGLVTKGRDAQRRPVRLQPAALERLTAWIDGYRLASEQSFRRLDVLLAEAAGEIPPRIPPTPGPAGTTPSTGEAVPPTTSTVPGGRPGRRPLPEE